MKKEERKKIEKAFFNYKEYMAQGVISTVEWAESNMAVDYSKVAVQTSPSNYKEEKLCEVIDQKIDTYRWSLVVEKVLDMHKFDAKSKFIRKHYFDKKNIYQVCYDIGICERTYKYWKEEIIEDAYLWAKEYKLV